MSEISSVHWFDNITSVDNLLDAWREFIRGKSKKKDVQIFEQNLIDNIRLLREDLLSGMYRHGSYEHFKINDPKPRDIHKASVRDRLLHHALYRQLYSFFDRVFIYDSYSCRVGKGTHRAMSRFRAFAYKVSKNNTRTCWVLKCDIRKFFASIDHAILKEILSRHLHDINLLKLLTHIIDSFYTTGRIGVGLPLGNLTSQLLVNIYMNEFDEFAKHTLDTKYYMRYADDFVFLHEDRNYLINLIPSIAVFLEEKLKLSLHPGKLHLKTLASGVDFLGWIHFSDHRVLRTSTKKRMFRRIEETKSNENTIYSYLSMLKWGNAWRLREKINRNYCKNLHF